MSDGCEDSHVVPARAAPLFPSCRLTLVLIGFLMFVHLYAQRVGMSVAIVCMVNQTALRQQPTVNITEREHAHYYHINTNTEENDPSHVTNRSEKPGCTRHKDDNGEKQTDGSFVWEKEMQGHILGAFFYGYLVSQIPGGLLAERFGAKWVLTGFFGLSTVATLLTPAAARTSLALLIFLRVLCGVGSGALYPAMHAMLGQWAPPTERSMLCGITYAGAMMGNVIAMPMSGMLCRYGFDGGWASVFYVVGMTSSVTLVVWVLLTSNTPSSHPRISTREQNYIVGSLKGQVSQDKPKITDVPWLKIFTSGPVWALIVANFCTDWGLYTYLTNIPTFYNEILFFNIQSNGLYSALPFLGLWATINLCPFVADKLIASHILSTITVRRVFNTIGQLGAGLLLIGLSFLDCSQTALAVTLLTLAVSISGFVFCGYFVNHMDIAPRYAGTLMGISNGLSSSAGFIAPYVASVITKTQTRESWQIVFFIAAGVYAFGAITYFILASGTIQPWASDAASTIEVELIKGVAAEGSDKQRSPSYTSTITSDKESPTPEPV